MDKKLSKSSKQNPVHVRPSPYREAPKKTGLGKGNPYMPRKENVSLRQEQKMTSKRKAPETCTSATQIYSRFELPPPKRIAPRHSTAGSSTSHDSTPPSSLPPCSPILRSTSPVATAAPRRPSSSPPLLHPPAPPARVPPAGRARPPSSTPAKLPRPLTTTPAREERQPLHPRTRLSAKTKRVGVIQKLGGAAQDDLATEKELELFWIDLTYRNTYYI